MIYSIAPFQKHPSLGKIPFFSNVNFEITMFIWERRLQWVNTLQPLRGGSNVKPLGQQKNSFFKQKISPNFDIISHRELTLFTIEIHIFRHLDFMHMNIGPKSFPSTIMLHCICLQNIPLSNRTANNTIPTRKLTLNSS